MRTARFDPPLRSGLRLRRLIVWQQPPIRATNQSRDREGASTRVVPQRVPTLPYGRGSVYVPFLRTASC